MTPGELLAELLRTPLQKMGPMSTFIAPMLKSAMDVADKEPAYAKLPMIADFIAAEKGVTTSELVKNGGLFDAVLEKLTGVKPEQSRVEFDRCPNCLHVRYLISDDQEIING